MENKEENKCWFCHGYGELKSHSDAPDRICPACDGTGKNNNSKEKETEDEE